MTSDTSLPLVTQVPMFHYVAYVGDTAKTSNTWCPLWNHVSVCAYVPEKFTHTYDF